MKMAERTLGEICDEGGGIIRTGPFGSQLHQSDYKEAGVPVVMPKDIVGDKLLEDGIARIGEEDVARLSQHKLQEGDIVYGRRGDIGRQALVTNREAGWLCGTGCLRITLGNSALTPTFLHYYLRQADVIGWIYNQAVGATMPNLNTGILRSVPIKYPPLETQRKIASILSAYDDLIENNTRRIKILEEMAQAIYREWFVNFRFPGHEKVRLVDSPLGSVPEGWEVVPLQDVCTRITDGAHKSPTTCEEGFPMASVKDMHDYGIAISGCRKISEDDFRELVRNDCKVKKDDVLIAKDGSYLKHCFVAEKDLDVVLLSSIAMLRPNDKIKPHLLVFILKDPVVKERMKRYVSGVAIPRIVLKDFRGFQIVRPTQIIQEQWGSIVDPIMALCWRLIDKNQNLRQARDLLLPKLISGAIDVSGLEMEVGAA